MTSRKAQKLRLSALAAAVAAASGPAMAAEYVVENRDPTGPGSLAAAIDNANETGGEDTITFAVTGTINLGSYALPQISEGVVITGPGAGALTIRGGTAEDAVFRVSMSHNEHVGISGLTIKDARYGGVAAFSGGSYDLELDNVVIANAGSADDPAYGPAIGVYEGADVTVSNSVIRDNYTSEGAAVEVFGEDANLTLVGSSITGNRSFGDAAAINAEGSEEKYPTLWLEDTLVSGNVNVAPEEGPGGGPGAISAKYANAYIVESRITNNRSEGKYSYGGGVSAKYSEVWVVDSEISGNQVQSFGGGIATFDSVLYLESGTRILNNRTSQDVSAEEKYMGGGVAALNSFVRVEGATISGNRSLFGGGMVANGPLEAKYLNVSNNRALLGGGLVSISSPFMGLAESSVTGNVAYSTSDAPEAGSGGGLFAVNTGEVFIYNTVVRNNSAAKYGGGVFAPNVGEVDVFASTISGNSAEIGGGIYAGTEDATIKYSSIENNTASEFAGGLALEVDDEFLLRHSSVANNRASKGPAVYVDVDYGSESVIWSSTLSGNRAGDGPAVMFRADDSYADLDIYNSTFSGNVASGHRAAIVMKDFEYGTIDSSTFINNAAAGADSGQLHITGGDITEGTPEIEVLNAVFSSSNSAEVVLGGTELADDGGYGSDPSLDVVLEANIMSNGFAVVGEGTEATNTFGAIPSDPQLGPLRDNGGLTLTHAPLSADGPTINQGNGGRPDGQDQRRAPQVAQNDLGAVEYTGNTAPRLVKPFGGVLSGVVGKTIDEFPVLEAFVDDEGHPFEIGEINGLPPGVFYDEGPCSEGTICGELELAGEYQVYVFVQDDPADVPPMQRMVKVTVKVSQTASKPVFIDDDDGGSMPFGLLTLAGAMAWLRRRQK